MSTSFYKVQEGLGGYNKLINGLTAAASGAIVSFYKVQEGLDCL